jgi:hypothetical protein
MLSTNAPMPRSSATDPSETYLLHFQTPLKFAPEWGIFFAWKVWRNTGILIIFAEEIATGGGEGIATYFLRFSKTYIKA